MPIARYVDGAVVDRRPFDISSIPQHKVEALGWKILVIEGSGPNEQIAVNSTTITITRSVPDPTALDVKAEAQRRIIARTGASDLNGCIVRQLNANMRANELNDIRHTRAWTTEEAAEADVLRQLAADIKAIRAKSNVVEALSPIPTDYTNDSYWTD